MMLMVDPLPPAFLHRAARRFAVVAHSGSRGTKDQRTVSQITYRCYNSNFGTGRACATPP